MGSLRMGCCVRWRCLVFGRSGGGFTRSFGRCSEFFLLVKGKGCVDEDWSWRADIWVVLRSVASFVGFMITVCYHTAYSRPWVYPAVALYALE